MVIPNHVAPRLSDLDLEVISHIEPGGNWKDVPDTVPSKRLETIRASFARGEGSRSTYYGRLTPDAPSYTINTYFTRPGNGCHIHYGQARTMSYREAARFQSFPDDFVFCGPKSAVAKQIGNAVPPLMSLNLIQTAFTERGGFVDLFAGAGGLSLGAVWAGWQPIIGNDIESRFLETYARNIHQETIPGDIRSPSVREGIISAARRWRRQNPNQPLLLVGGPPCQGFSTAGKVRSMDDERNHLFREYRQLIDDLSPDYFIFENVTGLLNMHGGAVFRMVSDSLNDAMTPGLQYRVLHSHQHGVPQRRSRVVLVGGLDGDAFPEAITDYPTAKAQVSGLPVTPGAHEAIGDLPALIPGEDGTSRPYCTDPPANDYQAVMRGQLPPNLYLKGLEAQRSDEAAGQMSLEV
jgi:DNA (cytosine-5)-methyltransferase 1